MDTAETMLARLENEVKHLVKAQELAAENSDTHRAALDVKLDELNKRVSNIENQLLGHRAFARGFQYAVYLGWGILGSLATAFIHRLWEIMK